MKGFCAQKKTDLPSRSARSTSAWRSSSYIYNTQTLAIDLAFVDVKPPEARKLKANGPQESWIVGEIAPPKPAWLFDQTIQPLQATTLHPAGSIGEEARVNVERRADADQQGSIESGGILGHETFLLRSAQADPDDVGICVVDGSDHLVPLPAA